MIEFESFRLDNKLQVYVIPDRRIRTAVLNIAYDVGARDEDPGRTGFAHLFEHLMFGGSVNIQEYDTPLQSVGGESNAFTTSDYTNYYLSLPSSNLETGFWLESDRMLSLSFESRVLEVQRKVVVEEFKQRYLNKPYGDSWHHLRREAYREHPYRWPVIGENIDHIESARMEDVRSFFDLHYSPDRAVLVVAGDVETSQVKDLSEKWFGDIPASTGYTRQLPAEPEQSSKRFIKVEESVPQDALYMVFHMCGRNDPSYQSTDLLSDVLGRGRSSRLHTALVKGKELFSTLSASVTGNMDPGLLVIHGMLREGIEPERAEAAIWEELEKVKQEEITGSEHNKVVNQALSSLAFSRVEPLDKAMAVAYNHLLGDVSKVNGENEQIAGVGRSEIRESAGEVLNENNATVMYYLKKNQGV